jgi:ribosomal protein S18 acetylase RimI-like enzyme
VRTADAAAIATLAASCGVFSASEIAIARELVEEHLAKGEAASGYSFLIADGADGIDGYTCFGPVPGAVNRWELYWIVVAPKARRSGLGHRLQRATEDVLKSRGCVMMVAETSTLPAYAPARGFYLGQGYRLLAEVPDWHDDGDGLAIFGKRL